MAGGNRPFWFKFFFDAKDAKAGADEIADSLEGIGDVLDGVSQKVDGHLDAVERRFRRSAQNIGESTDKVKKETKGDLAVVGGELGEEFIQNFGESLSSGDIGGVITDTLGGALSGLDRLGSRAAKAVAAGFAGIGIGVIVAQSIVDGIKQRQQEFNDALQGIFDAIDEKTGEVQRKAVIDTALTQLGEGSLAVGQQRAMEMADRLGISYEDLGSMLAGEVNPQLDAVRQSLANILQTTEDMPGGEWVLKGLGINTQAVQDAETLLQLTQQQNGALRTAIRLYERRNDLYGVTGGGLAGVSAGGLSAQFGFGRTPRNG